ncbi:MAG TPA: hypothetical protein VHO70_02615 [Chitinispirillaceae bacterium]|nr:hypothetical protein [Chitinispirillaceae bacterium]
MNTYDIELGQGDGDLVGVVLKENGIGADLTGATVKFSMKSDSGTSYDIECREGATIKSTPTDIEVLVSEGGITIPFTSAHTTVPGIYYGKFVVDLVTLKVTFPSGRDYVSVRVWEAV